MDGVWPVRRMQPYFPAKEHLNYPLATKGQILLRYIARQPARESRADLRPASELDSVMEFALSGAIQFASSWH